MNTTMRTRLFSLFLNLVMFVSFNLGMNNSYAQTAGVDASAQGCEETDPSATGGAYIYKPGCKFQEDKTATETWTPKTVNKILMGLMAVVAIASAKFAYEPNVQLECPQNKAANISLPAITLGGIAYVAGEIQANIRYKAAAKKATDITFTNVKEFEQSGEEGKVVENKSANNKQLEAFDNLIEIYEKQIGAAKTKTALTTVAEVGYVGAAGVELANILACGATCKANWAKLNGLIIPMSSTINMCPGAGAAFNAMYKANNAITMSKNLGYKAQGLQATAKFGNTAKNFFGSLSGGASAVPEFGSFDLPSGSLFATGNDASKLKMSTSISTGIGTLTAAGTTPYTVSLCQTSANFAAQLNAYTNVQPLQCCGTLSNTGVPTFSMNPKGDYTLPNNTDVKFLNILGEAGNLIEGKIIKNDSQRKIDEMTSMIAYNAVFEVEAEKILSSDLSKEKKLLKISQMSSRLEKAFDYLNKNLEGFSSPDLENTQINLANALINGHFDKMSQIMNELGRSFTINQAHAEGEWMKVLGWAGSILVLRAALKQIYTKYAGTSPKRRAIYFTILAGIGGYTLTQDAKTIKELKKRKEAVEKEREKFANASFSDSSMEEGGLGADTLNLKAGNYEVGTRGLGNYPGCIAATGNTYGPVKCPSLIKRDAMKIPKMNDKTRNLLSNAHVNSLGTLEDVAFNAANGSYLDNPNLLSGALASAGSNSNAMRAHNANLRAKIDELEKGTQVTDSKGNTVKPFSLSEFHDQMMSSLGGGGSSVLPAELAEDLGVSDKEKVEDSKVAAVSKGTPLQTGVTPNTDFSIDLGLDEEKEMDFDNNQASGEQKLEDFVVEQNDISKKTEVSIFKILSNRYLLSYPKVLEEKKK